MIITPGGRQTWLQEIAEFLTKLWEAPAEIRRVDTSALCYNADLQRKTYANQYKYIYVRDKTA